MPPRHSFEPAPPAPPLVVRPSIVTLSRSPVLLAKLSAAAPRAVPVRAFDDESRFRRAADERGVAVAIVDLENFTTCGTDRLVQHMRERRPHLTVIGVRTVTRGAARDLRDAARAGTHELLLDGVDDIAAATRVAIDGSWRGTAPALAAVDADLLGDEVGQSFLRYCLRHAHGELTVTGVARAIHVSRRTLARRLHDAGAPSAQRLMGWSRLLFACHLLDDTARSVEWIAFEGDWDSASALRNHFRRYLGVTPSIARARGALAVASSAFRRALRDGAAPSVLPEGEQALVARGEDQPSGG